MKSREQEERENYELLLKAAGNDPAVLARCVKELLLQDKTIKGPSKPIDPKEQAMRDAISDILNRKAHRK